MNVLGWCEMREEDQPPEKIWLDDDALNEHFTAVKERYSSGSAMESIDDEPMEQNLLTKKLRKG